LLKNDDIPKRCYNNPAYFTHARARAYIYLLYSLYYSIYLLHTY